MKRGFSLAYILTLVALAFLLVGLVVNAGLQLHARELHDRNRQQAIGYAKNGIERAVAKLVQDYRWGQDPGDGLQVPGLPGHPTDAGAHVTFDPEQRYASVNHFEREGTVEVPKDTTRLWSVGRFRGVEAVIEAYVARPSFPFALASSGPLDTRGAFFAGTLDSVEAADLPLDSPEFRKHLTQASLLSNGDRVKLQGAPVRVTGDIVCAGAVDLDAGVRVEGEVRDHVSPRPLPAFELASFDTAGKALLLTLPPGELRRRDPVKGYARCGGSLTVVEGLRLEEAILFVDGDLTVRGPLSGKGAVFVTGDVVLESAALGALDQLALVSGGSMRISGNGRERSKLVGLLVSKGDLSLSDVTVVGAVICAGNAGQKLTLTNVNALGNSAGLNFEFEVGWGVATEYRVAAGGFAGGGGGLVRLAQVTDPRTGEKVLPKPADFVERFDAANPNAPLLRESDFEVVLPDGTVQSLAEAGISIASSDDLSRYLIAGLNEVISTQAGGSSDQLIVRGKLSLDLNKFLRVGDTLQLVYRRIH